MSPSGRRVGGMEKKGTAPVPARRGVPTPCRQEVGRGPAPVSRCHRRCCARPAGVSPGAVARQGPGVGKRKGTGAALLVLPGAAGIGSAPGRTQRTGHAEPGSSCPGGCEVKWVGTPKPGSQGAAMRENRGASPALPQFPRLQHVLQKPQVLPGEATPRTHCPMPTPLPSPPLCPAGMRGPAGLGAVLPIPPHPIKTLPERVGDPRRAQPPNTDQFAASIPRRKNKVKTSVNL